ncbi:MAG: hypothetical protein M1569_01070 [Candidatus Marsarchaeota archaeon]|nr:hypothetical protein [Candidatus Marsarchaeota archaeon]MCL5412979.1 hypothetical protein [Candidatus Marsarchaeota archaeon]
MVTKEKIVIRQVNRPSKENVDALVNWFCETLDLGGRDALQPVMLKEIINRSMNGSGVTSKELNSKLDMPRTTVIYHLNRFIYSGIVVRKGRRYYLRSEDMTSTMEELQADMERDFVRLIEFAEKMDALFESGFYGRRRSRK